MEYQSSSNILFEGNHPFLTQRGVVLASDLKSGDKIIGITGEEHHISDIIKCGERPQARVLGEYNPGTQCLTIVEPDTTGVQQARSECGAG